MAVSAILPTLKYADLDGEHCFSLATESVSIGRSPDQDLVLKEAFVSRRHAVLSKKNGHFELTDQNAPRFTALMRRVGRDSSNLTNLPKDRYEVVVDGRGAGTFTADELAAGVNLASSTHDPWQPGGPWNAQFHWRICGRLLPGPGRNLPAG